MLHAPNPFSKAEEEEAQFSHLNIDGLENSELCLPAQLPPPHNGPTLLQPTRKEDHELLELLFLGQQLTPNLEEAFHRFQAMASHIQLHIQFCMNFLS